MNETTSLLSPLSATSSSKSSANESTFSQSSLTWNYNNDNENNNDNMRPQQSNGQKGSRIHLIRNTFQMVHNFTKSEREKFDDQRRKGLGSAALLICETILGSVDNEDAGGYSAYDPYDTENQNSVWLNSLSIVCRKIVTTLWLRKCIKIASWLLVFLSFIEPPAWCREFTMTTEEQQHGSIVVGCQGAMNARGPPPEEYLLMSSNDDTTAPTIANNIVDYYPNTGVLWITSQQGDVVELAIVGFILLYVLLGIVRDGCSLRLYFCNQEPKHSRLLRILRCISILALFMGQILSKYYHYRRPVRHLFRILLAISFTAGVQREFRNVAKMMPEILRILFLLFILIIFYAWLGVMVFYDTSQGVQYFPNLIEGCWTLWVCLTTANYPGAMMPGYNERRLVALYFVSFMMIAYFFMMNIILAAVVNNYENLHNSYMEDKQETTQQNLKQAFDLLRKQPNDERIDRETIEMLLSVLNEDFPQLSEIPEDEAKILFGLLDKDGTETITEEEFMEFCNVMLLEFEKSSLYKSYIELNYPNFYNSSTWQKIVHFINSDNFEIVIDIILGMNAIVIGIQSYPFLVGKTGNIDEHLTDGEIDTIWEGLETVFTISYCFEMTLKILVNGWKSFSSQFRNLYDLLITMLSVAASIYVYYPNNFSDSSIIWYIILARVLRLTRLLAAMESFQVTGKTFIDILPAVTRVFTLLFCIMYLFSTLGVMLFGGMITRDPSNRLSYLLLDTDFANSDFWANNFNDLLGGMNVLFSLLVTDCAEFSIGYEAVTESKWVRVFFLSFYIVGIVMVNNVVIAVVISHFIDQWNKQHEHDTVHNVEGEAVIANRRATFNATEITGTKTGATGDYVARVRRTSLVGQHSVLRRVFTSRSDSDDSDDLEMLFEEKEESIR